MTGGQLATLIRRMRRAAAAGQPGGLEDADLLRRFVAGRDEAAFEVLLWRHGAMVLNVCRRVLGHEQDAEDAFQATFLALARKAGTVARRASVGGWLYRVAYRAALAARQRRGREAAGQTLAQDVPAAEAEPDLIWRDLRPVLDEEVNRLPERQRRAFVLCYLEGKTHAEAARELGLPEGTVASRLSGARRQLRMRLTRRGLALPAGALAAVLAARAASAAVAPPLTAATLRAALSFAESKGTGPATTAAITLTEGVLRAMWMTKLKLALAAVLAVGVLGGGAGMLALRLGAAEPSAGQAKGTAASSPTVPERPAKEAARERPKEDESTRRLDEARKSMQVLEERLEASEREWSDARLRALEEVMKREESQRVVERLHEVQDKPEQFKIRLVEKRLSAALERSDSEKAAVLEKQLDQLNRGSVEREANFQNGMLPRRLELLKLREALRLQKRRQRSAENQMQADLEAARAKVRWLEGNGPDPTARSGELERKLDAVLHELDAVRRELRQRGTERNDKPD